MNKNSWLWGDKEKMDYYNNQDKSRLRYILAMLFCGIIALLLYLGITGNSNEIFTDIVNEYTALIGSNKSAERNLFYIFSLLGVIAYTVLYCFNQNNYNQIDVKEKYSQISGTYYLLIIELTIVISELLIYGSLKSISLAALFLTFIVVLLNKHLAILSTITFFMIIYSTIGVYRIVALIKGVNCPNLSLKVIIIIAFSTTLLFTIISYRFSFILQRVLLFTELIVPFTLLIFFENNYVIEKNGEICSLQLPIISVGFITILIGVFFIEAIINLRRNYTNNKTIQDYLTYGSCVSIMMFNQYAGNGASLAIDLHHHGENIIGYSQLFELGRKPFTEYIPVSGFYSVLHGFLLKVFGNGLMANYNLTTNIYNLLVIMLIVLFLRLHVKAELVFLLSLTVYLGGYNRFIFVLPIYLLLSSPCLINNKNLWLKVWIITSLLHGLFYPVFGAAVCLGFCPLAIWQLYTYIKSGKFNDDKKRVGFWIQWIACFGVVLWCKDLLLGLANHIICMAGQTLYADGLTRFGQVLPENFFSYIPFVSVRLLLYYICSYFSIIIIVWISVALFYTIGNVKIVDGHIHIANASEAFVALSISIITLVSISYGAVRMETSGIYSRNDGIIKLAIVAFSIIAIKYFEILKRNSLWLLGTVFFLMVLGCEVGTYYIDSDLKFSSYYIVPSDYVRTYNEVEKMGDCFIPEDKFYTIKNSNEMFSDMDKEKSYLGIVGNFGEYYLNEIPGDSVLETFATLRGYDAVKETVDLIKKNNTIVGYSINPIDNYYLYHYLMASGDYIWNHEKHAFFKNDSSTKEEAINNNKMYIHGVDNYYLGKTCGSWGKSISSLNKVFEKKDVDYTITGSDSDVNINLNKGIDGDEADFMFISLEGMDNQYIYTLYSLENEYPQKKSLLSQFLMKKSYNFGKRVYIVWKDDEENEHSMSCSMDKGRLLVPLGAGEGWLFNCHSEISIYVTENDKKIDVPIISDVRFLKAREVN